MTNTTQTPTTGKYTLLLGQPLGAVLSEHDTLDQLAQALFEARPTVEGADPVWAMCKCGKQIRLEQYLPEDGGGYYIDIPEWMDCDGTCPESRAE